MNIPGGRKVIQIAGSGYGAGTGSNYSEAKGKAYVIALCDDGSVWFKVCNSSEANQWHLLHEMEKNQ